MQRTTITLDDELTRQLDRFMETTGATSRSEAIRDLVRRGLLSREDSPPDAPCYGVISCTIDHSLRQLAARVPQSRLDRHDQTVAAISVPLDHSTTLDVTIMRSRVGDVSGYADSLFLERGVMHGNLGLVPISEDASPHVHENGPAHEHAHVKVQSGF